MLVAAATALLLSATPGRMLVVPLSAGEGVSDKTAEALSESVAAELRKSGFPVMTREEVTAVLTLERQKALFGCGSTQCVTELAGALDVDQLVSGSVARLGKSFLIHLKRVDARTAQTLVQADRRLQGGTLDEVLDALPGLVQELTGGKAPPTPVAALPAAPPAGAPELPSPLADEPFAPAPDVSKLELVTDGKGRYLAVVPFGGTSEPLFAGDGQSFWAQRVFGGGSEAKKRFDLAFWEPRQAATSTVDFKDGRYSLWCGRTEVKLTRVPPPKARALLTRARFYKPRWRRQGHALARDDEGNYVYVDAPRDGAEGSFHVYRGQRGTLQGEVARVLSQDSGGEVLGLSGGKLRLDRAKAEAEWLTPGGKTRLTWLPLEQNVVLIYTALGPYRGRALGTPCDPEATR